MGQGASRRISTRSEIHAAQHAWVPVGATGSGKSVQGTPSGLGRSGGVHGAPHWGRGGRGSLLRVPHQGWGLGVGVHGAPHRGQGVSGVCAGLPIGAGGRGSLQGVHGAGSRAIITPYPVYGLLSSAQVQVGNRKKSDDSPLLTLSCYFYDISPSWERGPLSCASVLGQPSQTATHWVPAGRTVHSLPHGSFPTAGGAPRVPPAPLHGAPSPQASPHRGSCSLGLTRSPLPCTLCVPPPP